MQSPPRAEPPVVVLRRRPWPTRRAPRLLVVAVAAVLAAGVALSLAHRPSQQQRAADLSGFLHDMTTDIESCAGGVSESLTALNGITAGTSHQVAAAISIARYGASNCSPANSMQVGDLVSYQVTESLASFHLTRVVSGLVIWADPDAVAVQTDVAGVLAARTPQARASATAALDRARRTLDAQRAAVDATVEQAVTALSARAAPPKLPG
ncbi:MAG: hypothetical protein JO016_09465 [Actinobacteria bacterium]|nr:hypothetical protein [Actinomycetota bacterium]